MAQINASEIGGAGFLFALVALILSFILDVGEVTGVVDLGALGPSISVVAIGFGLAILNRFLAF